MVDPAVDAGWDAKVRACSSSSFFHSAAWAQVLQDTYGYTPVYFTCGTPDQLQALLPVMEIDSWLTGRRGVSRRKPPMRRRAVLPPKGPDLDVTPLVARDRQVIESYGASGFRVSGAIFHGPVLVFPEHTVDWTNAAVTAESLVPVIEHGGVELLLIGLGKCMGRFPQRCAPP